MPKKYIAAGGTSANPPHLSHLALILAIMKSGLFRKVILIPCGRRIPIPAKFLP